MVAAFADAGVTATARATLAWADEMRLGLRGVVRRVWAPCGVKNVQPLVLTYTWPSLALAVNGRTGTLRWAWPTSMTKEAIATVVAGWQAAGIGAMPQIRDGHPSHATDAYLPISHICTFNDGRQQSYPCADPAVASRHLMR
ncbi:MAG: hypothetical protein ACRDJE_27785 [Dehalococcoidia bacterium]